MPSQWFLRLWYGQFELWKLGPVWIAPSTFTAFGLKQGHCSLDSCTSSWTHKVTQSSQEVKLTNLLGISLHTRNTVGSYGLVWGFFLWYRFVSPLRGNDVELLHFPKTFGSLKQPGMTGTTVCIRARLRLCQSPNLMKLKMV